ncbi:MAG TPA: hypothetical protein VGG76_10370 [Gemmatimonadaceae bacterium]|jgi:hypothetical protein
MKTGIRLLIVVGLVAGSSGISAAQQAPPAGPDLTGTWVINRGKSDFGTMAPPTIDSSVVTRVGAMYQVDATSDFGGQGMQHLVVKFPIGGGETTTDLPNGATIHTTTKIQGDTSTFVSTISVQGRPVALQTGRVYRSADGKTMTREIDVQPVAGPSTDPLHFRLVYDRK